ncbi:MAG TPA: GNAT family N-acetyltransferase [Candidatus Acidoferrales bacterium]|nr:GNAT family N-acetyltransferase [Candidatus Acidoferrales bacterium]
MKFIDLDLVRRLEMASALSGKTCADAAQKFHPELGAASEEIAGGIAVYAGVDSPVTQAVGVGLNGPVVDAELDRLEHFFQSRGAATAIELCPFAGLPLYEALAKREYRLVEVSNVLFRELNPADSFPPPPSGVTVRPALPDDEKLFTQTVAQGFAEIAPVTQPLLDVMEGFFHSKGNHPFLAFVEGIAAGGASAFAFDGVAGMFGASTLPQFRGRSVQTALLSARLNWAVRHGCDLAKGITLPGSTSHRNHERLGFRVAYTRTKLTRK